MSNVLLKDFPVQVGAQRTERISCAVQRSFQLRLLVNSNTGIDVECPFKLGRQNNMPAEYVLLKSGFGGFFPNTFDTVEIINRNDFPVTVRFTVSPDIISDSRVFGSVAVANTEIPVLNSFTTGRMNALYTRDVRTQWGDNFFTTALGCPFVLTENMARCVSVSGFEAQDGQYVLFRCGDDCYIDKIAIKKTDNTNSFSLFVDTFKVAQSVSGVIEYTINAFMRAGDFFCLSGAGVFDVQIVR